MFHKKQLITVAALITVGIVGRLALEAYPNIETLTAVSIIAGALLGPYLGL
ncbi:MAG TPA: ECF transporter S component, partial [Candidatus Kerfeldbacteria bacterium]|nr:ECF transporter S component [Candidatus Kerfeldbacteria bacterium]